LTQPLDKRVSDLLGGPGNFQNPAHHHTQADNNTDGAKCGAEAFGNGIERFT
jgi:hypothetical protein